MEKKDIKGLFLIGTPSRVSNSYGRNLPYMRYQVLFKDKKGNLINIADVFEKEELKKIGYWSTRSDQMSMTCWGTSQQFEAKISLGRWLGWNTKDWPAFSRKCEKFIKVLN